MRSIRLLAIVVLLASSADAIPLWTSPNHYRALVTVSPRGVTRKNSPATVDIDLVQALAGLGSPGTFDESTVEVIAYNASGVPKVFDSSRAGYERYLLPHRIQKYYGINRVTLSFVMPDHTYTQYAVYFDTKESGLGQPMRYPGLVGDGDWFREGYKRREINACHMDSFADFDGDGDLDLFKGGVEDFIWCYENVGGNKFLERGRLTSGGATFELPAWGNHRSWVTLEFHDWDNDGDQDLFASFTDGPEAGNIRVYENMTLPGGQITFTDRGRLLTTSGKALGSGWFSSIKIVDWDNDGKQDILCTRDNMIAFHRNVGSARDIRSIQVADGVYVQANGQPIYFSAPRVDCADLDGDGDLDVLCGTMNGQVYWFENAGTRSNPVLRTGRVIAHYEFMDCYAAPKIADWDGDGLLDFVVGRFWERTHFGEQPKVYGRLYKNVGTLTAPRFEARDADNGSPYTEQFQQCDAVKQNGVRSADWNNDGRMDLIAADTDGFIWLFLNTANNLFPVFATGERVQAGGQPVRLWTTGNWGGYARCDVADWNGDGKKDLIVADGRSWVFLYLNQNTDANPVLAAGTRMVAGGSEIQGPGGRASVLVADWDNDGKKDLVHADDSGYYWYENTGTVANPVLSARKTIYFNGQTVTYVRPNLGSYVDWDGDGKKDFIGAHFENTVRFYKNTGTGGVNVEPTFADKEGVTIVEPYAVQMISGADARDFNGDGDIDILTGQGHGGSGLRFYERDYINDDVNNTFPISTPGSSERGRTITEARTIGDTPNVTIPQAYVSACYSGSFYIQSQDRLGGIMVVQANHGRTIGERVDVRGTLATNAAGERYIAATSVTLNP